MFIGFLSIFIITLTDLDYLIRLLISGILYLS